MLILQRKPGEAISIGDKIKVTVVEINGGRVRFRIDAPKHIGIRRDNLRSKADERDPGSVPQKGG